MDYAEYVSRRPPSPPPLATKVLKFSPSPSLSAYTPHSFPTPPPPTQQTVSASLHRRALQNEYTTLTAQVTAAYHTLQSQNRQEAVRIRLEDMQTRADPPSQRVLHLALEKCNARLDALSAATRPIHEARQRMRVIEAKHLLNPPEHRSLPTQPPSPLRARHIRRDAVATLVDHIACALHDQIRIHYLLSVLASRLSSLRNALAALDRADRPATPATPDRAATPPRRRTSFSSPIAPPPNPPSATSTPPRPFSRRVSRVAMRPASASPSNHRASLHEETFASPTDRPAARSNVLRSQRSLPRRADARRLPLVVRRALSYNSTPAPPPPPVEPPQPHNASLPTYAPGSAQQGTTWWAADATGRSEARIGAAEMPRRAASSMAWAAHPSARTDLGNGLAYRFRPDVEGDSVDDESFPPVSPVSHCTTASEGSPRVESTHLHTEQLQAEHLHTEQLQTEHLQAERGSGGDSTFDQSVLVDIDSLCTEASSVLSSSRGMGVDANGEKIIRRGSVSSNMRGAGVAGDLRRGGKRLSRMRLGRMRIPTQIKRLWLEINELYGIVLTHGPHLLEEKIVTRASMTAGILGPWNSRRGKSATFRATVQVATVAEAIRKVDAIVLWQQRLIVAIRRDFLEQRKALQHADHVISEAYLKLLDEQQVQGTGRR